MTDGVSRRDFLRELDPDVELHPPEPPSRQLFLEGRYIFRT